MSEFLIESPASIARTEVQRIERSIIALRAQHEPSQAREEQEASLWAQHAELAKQLPSTEQTAAANRLAVLERTHADLIVTAKINGDEPDEKALADLAEKIAIADGLARGEA